MIPFVHPSSGDAVIVLRGALIVGGIVAFYALLFAALNKFYGR